MTISAVTGPLTARRRVSDIDGDDLVAAAAEFRRLDLFLLAAGAAAQAAVLHRDRGDLGAAASAAALASRYEKVHRGAPDAGHLALSERQREVARLIAIGLSNRDISEHLHVSVRTVESHIYRACVQLGIRHRAELASVVRTVGLSVAPGPATAPPTAAR